MNLVRLIVIAILALLAAFSGATKIMLMEQEVAFFGSFGFTHPMLIAFGIAQLVGSLMLIARSTRLYGALLIAASFAISAGLLLMAGSLAAATITLIAIGALAWIAFELIRR
jgi:hypothetical protein